jgi:hypothetical protein
VIVVAEMVCSAAVDHFDYTTRNRSDHSGGRMSGDERKARRAGMFIHLIVMGTLVFGTIYAVSRPGPWTAQAGLDEGDVHSGHTID